MAGCTLLNSLMRPRVHPDPSMVRAVTLVPNALTRRAVTAMYDLAVQVFSHTLHACICNAPMIVLPWLRVTPA